MNQQTINHETGEILDSPTPKLTRRERYLVRLAELLEEARLAKMEQEQIDKTFQRIENSYTDSELVLIGKHLSERVSALQETNRVKALQETKQNEQEKLNKELNKEKVFEVATLYQVRGRKKPDNTIEFFKEHAKTLPALEECRQKEECRRIALKCPLFPLIDNKGELSGVCSERLDTGYKQFDQKQGAW